MGRRTGSRDDLTSATTGRDGQDGRGAGNDHDVIDPRRLRREARTMMLYVAIVLLAETAALPAGEDATGHLRGPVDWWFLAVLWGTAIGLALSHSFAFHIANHGVGIRNVAPATRAEIVAEVKGVTMVALIATVPVLLRPDWAEERIVPFILALTIGGVGFVVERDNGRSLGGAIAFASVSIVLGLVVASAKYLLAFH